MGLYGNCNIEVLYGDFFWTYSTPSPMTKIEKSGIFRFESHKWRTKQVRTQLLLTQPSLLGHMLVLTIPHAPIYYKSMIIALIILFSLFVALQGVRLKKTTTMIGLLLIPGPLQPSTIIRFGMHCYGRELTKKTTVTKNQSIKKYFNCSFLFLLF